MSIPEPPPEFVSRPRLLELLDAAAETATVFAGAGAGFGKTVLLAEWARSRVPGTVAWVSADVGDNDDRLFWSAVLKALHGCTRVPPDSLLRTILVPDEPGRDLAFLAQLADALDALPEPVLLVLDGVQEITAPRTWNGLRALTRHQPAGLRLALSSRREPPLPLVRARLADRLIELGADELRFSVEEAREFLGPAIRPDQVDELIARAEGWPAALRLAIGSAARHGDLRAFFAGRDRALQDYLRDEVLAPLTGAQRELLRAVSIGQDVPPGLAAALADRADAEAILHELAEPATLLVRAGGAPPLYRLPALLRACLHAELARQEPDRLRALHAVAARWFAAHGDPAAALLHCVHSGNAIRVDRLLRRHAVTLFLAGEHHVLRLALAMLDDRLLSAEPLLALVSAALCLETGESGTAGLHLARAEAAWPPAPSAELEVLRQLAYARRAQVDQPPARAVRAADGIDVELARTTELGGLATLHRMSALVAADDRTAAREGLLPVLDAAERRGQDFLVTQCLTQLGTVACRDGDYRVMDTLARRVLTRERTHERQHTLEGAQASALLAYGALLRGEPAESVEQAKRIGRRLNDAPARTSRNLHLVAETLRGAAEFELGAWQAGLRRMRRARARLGTGRACPPAHVALCAVLEHRAALRFGAADQARETIRWAQPMLAHAGELSLMRARTQLGLGRQGSASSVLRALTEDAAPMLLAWSNVEALLVGVQAALAVGASERAVRLLDKALRTAEPADIRFPFVFAPPDVGAFLTARLGRLGTGERFAGHVLALRRRLHTPPMPAPLTERERSVLRLLPTQRSIDEIAEDLTVSPNTVKTHVRGIYAKLDVRSRRDAVAIALQRGLLE